VKEGDSGKSIQDLIAAVRKNRGATEGFACGIWKMVEWVHGSKCVANDFQYIGSG
jgi:hypothetical protein